MTNEPRYEVQEREGEPHGDVYEMEIDTYYYIVDKTTGNVIHTFIGTYFSKLGDDGTWQNGRYLGVEKVEINEADNTALVYEVGRKEPKVVRLDGDGG